MADTRPLAEDGGGTSADPRGGERGGMLTELCNAIVHIHKRFYGKGPTRARAHLSQDLLTVVLDGVYTRGEQTLHDRGHEHEVIQLRRAMQRSVEGEFRSAIETIMHRAVRSFMSATDPANDLQVEIFILQPQTDRAPTGAGDSAPAGSGDDRIASDKGLARRAVRARDKDHEVL
jgi:uncharacterized protein YbcI